MARFITNFEINFSVSKKKKTLDGFVQQQVFVFMIISIYPTTRRQNFRLKQIADDILKFI